MNNLFCWGKKVEKKKHIEGRRILGSMPKKVLSPPGRREAEGLN